MNAQFIEVTNGFNWGKFMVGEFTSEEWARRSAIDEKVSLLQTCGWRGARHRLVLDMQTGEGIVVAIGGHASADLNKHRVWVCPMFEPFLTWLYRQPLDQPLPPVVNLTEEEAPSSLFGYRRTGK